MGVFATPNFQQAAFLTSEVPGAWVLGIGEPCRKSLLACQGCARDGQHKNWVASDNIHCTSLEKERYIRDQHDALADTLQRLQALNFLLGTHWDKVFKPNDGTMYQEITFGVVSVAANLITCTYGPDNNPKDQNGRTLDDWGFLEVYGSQIARFGLQAIVSEITEPDGAGCGQIKFVPLTYLPSGGLLNMRNNPNVPITVTFRYASPKPIWSALYKLDTMECKYHTEPLPKAGLTAGLNIIWNDGRKIGFPDRKVVKVVNEVEMQVWAPLQNRTIGGVNCVTLDLTGFNLDEAGLTELRVSCWMEADAALPASNIVWTQENPTATDYKVGPGVRLAGGSSIDIQCRTDGTDWHPWDHGTFDAVWNDEIQWWDFWWRLTGDNMLYYPPGDPPPDPLPEGWEPPPDPDPIPVDAIQCSFLGEGAATADFHLLADRCAWDCRSTNIGRTDPKYGCKRFCTKWNDLSPAEQAAWRPGCCNEACAAFVAGSLQRPNTYSAVTLGGIQASYPFTYTLMAQQTTGTYQRRGTHSQGSVTLTDIDADGTTVHDKVQNLHSCGGWGGLGYDQYTYETPVIDPETGEQATDPETGEPLVEIHYVNTVALVGDIANLRTKTPESGGLAGCHRDKGDWVGHWTRKREWVATNPSYPQVADTFEPQEYPDGRVTRGFWDGNRVKQAAADANTKYYGLVEFVQGVKSVKDTEPRGLRVVRTIRFGATSAAGTAMAIRHAYTTYSKPAGTGEPDVAVSAKTGGTSVLHPTNRPKNYLCPESIVGPGNDDAYIAEDMGLRIPERDDIPEQFRGLIWRISTAVACDAAVGYVDLDWPAESYKLENVAGLPTDFYNVYKYGDSITIAGTDDELAAWAAFLSAMGNDVSDIEFEIVEQPWAKAVDAVALAKPDGSNGAVSYLALPGSGRTWLETDPVGWCIVMSAVRADFNSYLSVSKDLQPVLDTQARINATPYNFQPVLEMAGDNRQWNLNIEYERWRYNADYTQIIGDGYENKFTIDTPPPPPTENTSGEIMVGVFDVNYDEVPAYRFTGQVALGGIPARSEELDRLFVGSAGIASAGTNTTLSITSSGILRTIYVDETGMQVWRDDPLNEGLDVKLALYGVKYVNGVPTYTNLATLEAGGVSGDGRYRTYPSTKIVRAYSENKTLYQAFIVIPVVGDWALPPGAAVGYEFLYQLIQQGLERRLYLNADNIVVGTIKLRQFSCHIINAAGGVVQLGSSGFYLPDVARPSYDWVPANVGQH
jgi:hypothetical protein